MTAPAILRFRDIEPSPYALPGPRVQGFYKLEAMRPDGRIRPLTDWFPNLITNVGLDAMGSLASNRVPFYVSVVGTGNTAPHVNDTNLVTQVGQSGVANATNGRQPTEPYFGWMRKTFQHAQGQATGNLAEVGIRSETTATLMSRALILDGGGVPTTITVLADEFLNVSYELRMYPPLTDTLGTITLEDVLRDTIGRANQVTDDSPWSQELGVRPVYTWDGIGFTHAFYEGPLNDILTLPGGASVAGGSITPGAYTGGTYKKTFTGGIGLSAGNFAGGIGAWMIRTSIGSYKIGFDPPLMKTNTKTLSLTAELTWARKV